MSYIILRGCWCHIAVQNIHAPTVDKIDNCPSYYNMKDSFCEELEHVFDKFPKHHMKVLLGNISAKVVVVVVVVVVMASVASFW
jgi:hypothetical protein